MDIYLLVIETVCFFICVMLIYQHSQFFGLTGPFFWKHYELVQHPMLTSRNLFIVICKILIIVIVIILVIIIV